MIKDPSNGNTAAVTSARQVLSYSESIADADAAVKDGRVFQAQFGTTLTDAAATGLLHIRNGGDKVLEILEVLVNVGESTGGNGPALLAESRNDSGGSVLSGGSDVTADCQDYGDSGRVEASIKGGSTGDSLGSSPGPAVSVALASEYSVLRSRVRLPLGRSYGLQVTAPTGNTGLPVTVKVLIKEDKPTG